MLPSVIVLVLLGFAAADVHYYDTYSGSQISDEDYQEREDSGLNAACTIQVEDCNVSEGRRIDGTCNSLTEVTRGAAYTPSKRILDADFTNNTEPRLAASGKDLPLSRRIRTTLLSEGRVPSDKYTQLLLYYFIFINFDFGYIRDTLSYSQIPLDCCATDGNTNYMCIPQEIPADDPVHRFSGERCINMVRPESFATAGCVSSNTSFSRINYETPTYDLSQIYGSNVADLEAVRLYEGGLLKTETVNNKTWPPSLSPDLSKSVCVGNKDGETRCHATPDLGSNIILPVSLITIWIWNLHNRIAEQLAEVNPCWDDEKLFTTAREINIALNMQIYFYEALPLLFGEDNLLRDGIISSDSGYRDLYDDSLTPAVLLEFILGLRWLNTMMENRVNLYDDDGNYVSEFSLVEATWRTGWLAVDDRLAEVTQGTFRKASAANDYVVDPTIAETGRGGLEIADFFTNNIATGRYFGLKPYVSYLEYCNGKNYSSFEDLSDVIDVARLQLLQELYESVTDIDFMAGLFAEKPIEGGAVPSTLYCIVKNQLLHTIKSDRFWYELQDRPNAFTEAQLVEMRKYKISRLVCRIQGVSNITPKGFLLPGDDNEIGICTDVTVDVDLAAVFTDSACSSS